MGYGLKGKPTTQRPPAPQGQGLSRQDRLYSVIKSVMMDEKATSDEKLERIDAFLEVYAMNNTPGMEDMI